MTDVDPRIAEYVRTTALIKAIQATGLGLREYWFTSENGRPPRLSYMSLGAHELEPLASALGVTA